MRHRRSIASALALLLLAAVGAWLRPTPKQDHDRSPAERSATSSHTTPSGSTQPQKADLDLSSVPEQERSAIAEIARLIDAGGPFRYAKDGSVFRNAQHRLPAQDRSYYREYTVPTPSASNRGARRIIAGGGRELYYTRDHYRTFVRIR